jgi:CheY-like chemotaxis protein
VDNPANTSGSAVLEPRLCEDTDLRTILLLDPVSLFLRYEETVLHRRDWRIHGARTAAQALETLEREHVDLLVMEHALPDSTGEELIRSVRSNAKTRATGILVLTARGTQDAVLRCLDAGANGVLFKPVTRQELCSRVEDLLFVAARRHVRTLVRLRVDAKAGSAAFFGNTVNVSAGGMLLECSTPLNAGEALDLRFSLPGDPDPLALRARVVRAASESTPSGRHACGLAFEGITDAERRRLDAFVTATRDASSLIPSAG